MHKLYLVMVGLPARGKSRLARRICGGLAADGFRSAIFNNGDVRRELLGAESTLPEFYSPDNAEGRRIREEICRQNLIRAKEWLNREGDVAILDATNVSRARRAFIERTLTDHPVLFLECVNEDPVLLNACIRNKTRLPEYAGYTEDEALASFVGRIGYYEAIYEPVGKEQYWLCVDTMSSRILAEQPCEGSPYYPAIREIVVSWWVQSLYLARHGQTEYNVQGRIGGDPPLTAKGRMQAEALALHKAREVARNHAAHGDLVIGADTIVGLDGMVLVKPRDAAHALEMLTALSGRRHHVYTGVALLRDGAEQVAHEDTEVHFCPLTREEMLRYIATGEPMDKAGAYGIQGRGALFIDWIQGDYCNVVGLPLCRLGKMLAQFRENQDCRA